MPYALLADLVVAVHLAFIALVLAGGLIVLRWRGFAWVHLPCALWGVYAIVSGTICPLTPLEVRWRLAAGQTPYSGTFIANYIEPIIYPPGMTRATQVAIGLAFLTLNLLLYWLAWRRPPPTAEDGR